MENLKVDTWSLGNDFDTVAKKAQAMATDKQNIEFEFNGVDCVVSPKTNLAWLYRDYANSWTMEWKTAGPDCVSEYDEETKNELKRRTKISEEKAAEESRKQKIKEDKERAAFENKTVGVEMEFANKENWEKGKAKNTDSYGGCIYDYAEAWAKLMQSEINKGSKLQDIASKTSHELGFFGITGFMYGAAVSILSQCWIHGETLRKWHNK